MRPFYGSFFIWHWKILTKGREKTSMHISEQPSCTLVKKGKCNQKESDSCRNPNPDTGWQEGNNGDQEELVFSTPTFSNSPASTGRQENSSIPISHWGCHIQEDAHIMMAQILGADTTPTGQRRTSMGLTPTVVGAHPQQLQQQQQQPPTV